MVYLGPWSESEIHFSNKCLIVYIIHGHFLEFFEWLFYLDNFDLWHAFEMEVSSLELTNWGLNRPLDQIIYSS